jgi:hypothetical protein
VLLGFELRTLVWSQYGMQLDTWQHHLCQLHQQLCHARSLAFKMFSFLQEEVRSEEYHSVLLLTARQSMPETAFFIA